jgi:pimeloyl-ACP methyl ester carboxylesterase
MDFPVQDGHRRRQPPRFTAAVLFLLAMVAGCGPDHDGVEVSMTPASVPYPYIQGFAGRLCYEDVGAGGIPVVFVHGNGGNRLQWSAQLDHLRPHRRAVALDLRGFGDSEPAGNADYNVKAMAADIAAVVDALNLRRFVVVGHSYGGAVAIAYLGRHPDRIAGLLLVDPVGDTRQEPPEELQAWLDQLKPETYRAFITDWFEQILQGSAEGVRESVLRSVRATPREVFVGAIENLRDFDPITPFEGYSGPRLTIITALNQRPFSLQNVVPGLPHRRMDGVSHWLMMDRPELFNTWMDEFLATVNRAENPAPSP